MAGAPQISVVVPVFDEEGAAPALAQSPADFYRGKTVTVVVGYAPGGGYDIYSRLLARHLGNHIPG